MKRSCTIAFAMLVFFAGCTDQLNPGGSGILIIQIPAYTSFPYAINGSSVGSNDLVAEAAAAAEPNVEPPGTYTVSGSYTYPTAWSSSAPYTPTATATVTESQTFTVSPDTTTTWTLPNPNPEP